MSQGSERGKLKVTAVALGAVTADEAESMSTLELRAAIEAHTGYEHQDSGSQGLEGKEGAKERKVPAPGQGEGQGKVIVIKEGHILVASQEMEDENGQTVPEGTLMIVISEANGTIYASDGENTYEFRMESQSNGLENTGFAQRDVVRTNLGHYGLIRGITKNNSLAVNPVEYNDPDPPYNQVFHDSTYGWINPSNRVLGPSFQVEVDEVAGHWSMHPDARWFPTEDAGAVLDNLIKPLADAADEITDTPFAEQAFMPSLQYRDSNDIWIDIENPNQLRKGIHSPAIGLESWVGPPDEHDQHPGMVTSAEWRGITRTAVINSAARWDDKYAPGLMEVSFKDFDFSDVIDEMTSNTMATGEPTLPSVRHVLHNMPLKAFEVRQEEKDKPESEESDSQSNPKEGMMEDSRRTLASLKGTPSTPKKASVSSQKIKSLVEETMSDTDALSKVLDRIIEQRRDELRDLLGINDDMKALGDQVLDDIETAFKAYSRELEQWKHAVEEKVTTRVEFKIPEMPEISIKDPHMTFDDLLFNVHLRKPTIMIGPSGSGKTWAAREVARLLDLPFSFSALGPTQTEAKFSGYPDAQGFFIPTEFYFRYRYGGVMLLDEMDAGNANVLVWLNAAIQNKIGAFPRGFMTQLEMEGFNEEAESLRNSGGMIEMHPDCVILAAANTYGRGADMVYQGRNALDGATLKRFKFLVWDYDEVLERKLTGDDMWVNFVQAVRKSVNELSMHHIVSPVDSIDGAQMIAAGQDWQKVAMQTVFAGLKEDEVRKIMKEPESRATLKDLHAKLQSRQDRNEEQAVTDAG